VSPDKYAPPDTGTFTLVLLKKRSGCNTTRLLELLATMPRLSAKQAAELAYFGVGPLVSGLSFPDALLWQFELVCCDTVSIFLRDEVVESATKEYLNELYSQVQTSSEFDDVRIWVSRIPHTEAGEKFVSQFFAPSFVLGLRIGSLCPYVGYMMRKKAHIMMHWAEKIGAKMILAGQYE
jgi:hypothetical protein